MRERERERENAAQKWCAAAGVVALPVGAVGGGGMEDGDASEAIAGEGRV